MSDMRGERLQVMLSPGELALLDDFRFKHRMPTRAAAVRELLKLGLTVATPEAIAGMNPAITASSTVGPTGTCKATAKRTAVASLGADLTSARRRSRHFAELLNHPGDRFCTGFAACKGASLGR